MDWLMLLKAFVIGGVICVIGQLLIDLTAMTLRAYWCCLW